MKTKLVYVLTCSKSDIYALQVWVSATSAKHHNPDIKIELVCDAYSEPIISGMPLVNVVDKVTAVEFPDRMSQMEMSRRIKTGLRDIVEGDFFYIDTDTVITGTLKDLDSLPGSIYAVADAHCTPESNPYLSMIKRNATIMGYSLNDIKAFFNGGAVYAKDDIVSRQFYRNWAHLYDISTQKCLFIDQPSFAMANIQSGNAILELDGKWNCQLKHGMHYMDDVRVLHYLWTAKRSLSPFILGREEIWNSIRGASYLPHEVTRLFDCPSVGIQESTYLASKEEMDLLSGRSYRTLLKLHQESSSYSAFLDACIKFIDRLYKLTHKHHI